MLTAQLEHLRKIFQESKNYQYEKDNKSNNKTSISLTKIIMLIT